MFEAVGMGSPLPQGPVGHASRGMSPLRVITSVFNPRRFASRYRLYREFAAYCERNGIELITVELAFGKRPFEVTDRLNPFHIQLRTECEIWHKERLLNLGLQRLLQIDPATEYVAWIDADVSFTRHNIAAETVEMLQHHTVVQMFETSLLLGPNGDMLHRFDGAIKAWAMGAPTRFGATPGLGAYSRAGHPGLAWAFRRETLDHLGGWLDFCAAGSGDLHMMAAFTGDVRIGLETGLSRGYYEMIRAYAERADKYVARNTGYVTGAAMHHWHGKSGDRGYGKRWDILKRFQFDPYTDIKPDAQGCWQWTGNKPEMAFAIAKSLSARNEDSIDC